MPLKPLPSKGTHFRGTVINENTDWDGQGTRRGQHTYLPTNAEEDEVQQKW